MGTSADSDVLFPTADRSLVARVRRGGRDAFDALWLRHEGAVQDAARVLAPGCDAERVAQEVRQELRVVLERDDPPANPVRVQAYRLLRALVGAEGTGCADVDRCVTVRAFESLAAADRDLLWYADVEPVGYGSIATVCGVRPSDALAALAGARQRYREQWSAPPRDGAPPGPPAHPRRRTAASHGVVPASSCPCSRAVEQAWGPDRALRRVLLLVVLGLPSTAEADR